MVDVVVETVLELKAVVRSPAEAVLESKSTLESEAVVKDRTRTFRKLNVEL